MCINYEKIGHLLQAHGVMRWRCATYLVCVCQQCWRWVVHLLWTSRNSVEDCRTPDTGEWRIHPGKPGPSLGKSLPPRRLQLQGAKVSTKPSAQAGSRLLLKAPQRYFLSHSAILKFISHCQSGMWSLFDHISEAECSLTIIRATLHPSLRVAHISRSTANERYEEEACFEKKFYPVLLIKKL